MQVCPTVLHQGHEKEERLASLRMLVVVLFRCINVLCLVEDFEGAQTTCTVFSCMQLLDQILWLFKEGLVGGAVSTIAQIG